MVSLNLSGFTSGLGRSILLFIFIPVALVGARRYRLSRTSWRGIRFSFRGKAWRFILLFIKGSFLTGLTFGLYYPFFLTQRQAFMVSNSYFGNERFDFNGRGRDLFPNYLLALLLTFPTLGLGWFWFVARKKDIIRKRGENISGAELDRVIGGHPSVLEAAAIPVPSELGEDDILVAVVSRPGATVAAEEIAAWCRERLAPIKVPRYVVFVEALPKTPTHRVEKYKLRTDRTLRERAVDLGR